MHPANCQRRKLVRGYRLTLRDDHQWIIPAARLSVQPLWDLSRPCAEQLFAALRALELQANMPRKPGQSPGIRVELPVVQLLHLAIAALQVNYHIDGQAATRLRLLDDAALRRIAMLVADVPAILRHQAKVKRVGSDLGRRWLDFRLWQRGLLPGYVPTWADIFWLD
jgi:hypothetical protein